MSNSLEDTITRNVADGRTPDEFDTKIFFLKYKAGMITTNVQSKSSIALLHSIFAAETKQH